MAIAWWPGRVTPGWQGISLSDEVPLPTAVEAGDEIGVLVPVADRDDLVLTPRGLTVGALTLPWGSVTRAEEIRWHGRWPAPTDERPDNLLVLRVADYDDVVGLRPVVAGLANLTRPRRFVLCRDADLRDPFAVSAALRLLVGRPPLRALLAEPEGVRLVRTGLAPGE